MILFELLLFYLRHVWYRVCHYAALVIGAPTRCLDYALGNMCYKKSPYYHGLSYARFTKEHGRDGEFQLWRKARGVLGKDAVWFCNLYLPKKDGTTCEIDLLALSCRGVFVFESKNYNGWIYADVKKPYWYQMVRTNLKRPPKKYSFFNPVMQNAMHLHCLQSLLLPYSDKIFPLTVFGNRCRIKKLDLADKNVICKIGQFKNRLRKYKKGTLTSEDIQEMCRVLTPYRKTTYTDKLQHIANIENKKK